MRSKLRWVDSIQPSIHLSVMLPVGKNITQKAEIPVFHFACWALGMTAFAQFWIAAMALSVRFGESRQVRFMEKEVIRPITVRVPVPVEVPREIAPVVETLPLRPIPELPQPSPISVPQVEDVDLNGLLTTARDARVGGDMGKAIVKLEQALLQAPEDPNVFYELGLVHEQMGVYDRASEYFEKVYQMGLSKAGKLYELSALKLRDGFAQPADSLGKLSLGRVRIFNNPDQKNGQQVILTIPVQKAPEHQVDVADIAVEVRFFNKTNRGEVTELDDPSWAKSEWVTLPFDWAGGEENLRMTYTMPVQDMQTEHLFGKQKYYGQVVTLTYGGEVLDVQAWPRDLAAKIAKQPSSGFGESLAPEFEDSLPSDFDRSIPLLPSLPEN